jgi:hypothetical protein
MHWLGSAALPAALVSELVLPPTLEPELPLIPVLPEVPPAAPALVPAEPAVLLPAEPPAAPPVWAHDALARPTSAAATAAVSVLTITV